MPEIAEVRTVAKTLNKSLVNKSIVGIDIYYDKIIKTNLDDFKKNIVNKKIISVSSFGKWLLFNLGEYTLLSHLRMEGKYFIKSNEDPIVKHEHIVFHLDDGLTLRYHDVRKFGIMMLVKTSDVYNTKDIKKLGKEPDDESLSKEYSYDKIHKSNKPIKELLLDQSIINGVGNIYVDEVLFASKIMPTRVGKDVKLEECESIKNSSRRIIEEATLMGGSTIRSYTSSLGVIGHYQEKLMVHTKAGEHCKICNSIIIKTRVGGRGTYYCQNCQK